MPKMNPKIAYLENFAESSTPEQTNNFESTQRSQLLFLHVHNLLLVSKLRL